MSFFFLAFLIETGILSCPYLSIKVREFDYLWVYKDHCYLFSPIKFRYPLAEKYCKNMTGTLAMPKTEDENSEYIKALEEFKIKEPAWIGISDRAKEGEFVYADGSKLKINKFNTRINPLLGFLQDCVAFDPSSGLWHRYMCDSTPLTSARRPFICQF